MKSALERFPVDETLRWFRSLGLYTIAEDSGRVYPYSDQANSVVDVLRFALLRENISLLAGVEVTKVKKTDKGFTVETAENAYTCDRLIVACGGLAGTKLGGSMSGYKLLRAFGHKVTKLRPALVQIKSGRSGCNSLKGVRANCHAAVYCNERLHSQSTGEIQFTEYGISGPVVFEISRDVCVGAGVWRCVLDFLPDMGMEELYSTVYERRATNLPAEELFTGILHNRLGRILTASAGIKLQRQICDLSDEELRSVCLIAKELDVFLTEPLGMDSAQVTAGGVVTAEFDPATMESHLVPGLYACGEVLDVDGDCGGFNLQWAWSSGILAGQSAGKVIV